MIPRENPSAYVLVVLSSVKMLSALPGTAQTSISLNRLVPTKLIASKTIIFRSIQILLFKFNIISLTVQDLSNKLYQLHEDNDAIAQNHFSILSHSHVGGSSIGHWPVLIHLLLNFELSWISTPIDHPRIIIGTSLELNVLGTELGH